MAQLTSQFDVNSNQISAWKTKLLSDASELFEDGRKRRQRDEVNDEELFAQIGRLKMELEPVNRKRVQRMMRIMGIEAVYPRARTTRRHAEHRVFPYLLRAVAIVRKDQVGSTDITYIPIRDGFMDLVAVMDWHTRYVLSWRLSNTLEGQFCSEALEDSLTIGRPEIFNTDQGCQFTSPKFTSVLQGHGIAISMTRKRVPRRGRALENVFIERLWRTVKYEDIYLKRYDSVRDLTEGLRKYFQFYCHERPHSSLGRRTPAEMYLQN